MLIANECNNFPCQPHASKTSCGHSFNNLAYTA